jgi:Raf kinase inhibitor-like YbhB/YbcL family protein
MRTSIFALACAVFGSGCGHGAATTPEIEFPNVPKLDVTSPAFAAGADIPRDHTCEGADVAPALAWANAPAATRQFAIIVDDPDAPDPAKPQRTWVHWVVVGIPAKVTSLPQEPAGSGAQLPAGAFQGKNDFGKQAWGGPCPPTGRHRYFFKVYAVDVALGPPGIKKSDLLVAMEGHVLAMGSLIGTYAKSH